MGKEWTQERREKQAETIRKNKPWGKSTGPKTPKGKQISSTNARKHGACAAEVKELKKALRANREFLQAFHAFTLARQKTN